MNGVSTQLPVGSKCITVIVFRGDKILSGAFKFRQSIWNFLVVLNIRFLGGCMDPYLKRGGLKS